MGRVHHQEKSVPRQPRTQDPAPSAPPQGASPPAAKATPHRAGAVALIGRPNVGKSTLLNALLGEKLAITSPRPQTTRHRLLGILAGEGHEVAFLDTPGFMRRAKDQLDRRMRSRIREALDGADFALLVVPPVSPGEPEAKLVADLRRESKPAILAVNKVDKVRKEAVLPIIEAYARLYPFLEIVPVSALRRDGTGQLRELIVAHLPEGPAQFGSDELTDRSERFLAAQLVSEQLFRLYGQEVPYDTAVEIEGFEEADGETRRKDLIQVAIYVSRPAQRRILIGHGGGALKAVGTEARLEMERMLGREVFLEIWVKVRPNWRDDELFLNDLDY